MISEVFMSLIKFEQVFISFELNYFIINVFKLNLIRINRFVLKYAVSWQICFIH